MKHAFLCFAVVSLMIACKNTTGAKEAESITAAPDTAAGPASDTSSKTSVSLDSAAMVKNSQAYMAPSAIHKMMASWTGTWDADITMWMAAGAPVQKAKGISMNKMVMGGRYQVSTNTSKMMGMPFEGQGTLAYDNSKKAFISTWIDNMGTGIMTLRGPWDSTTKSIQLKGTMVNPSMADGSEENVRETVTIIDDKTQLMEMFAIAPDGKEYKSMEIRFTLR